MLTSSESASSESSVAQLDVSSVVTLRQRVSRAATSLKIIGFISGVALYFELSRYWGEVASLLCAMLISGIANSTAKKLRSGSLGAATVAAIFWLWWFAFNAFEAFPKALENDFDGYSFVGALIFLLPLFFLAWGLLERSRYRVDEVISGDADLRAYPWEEGHRI